ncbi:hypothetical protein HDV05_008801 [Chytridiales sp. JEL 0842]|nr:hypothetical protein HDV05_008801 [Chytridiales sp. JEL 0842]
MPLPRPTTRPLVYLTPPLLILSLLLTYITLFNTIQYDPAPVLPRIVATIALKPGASLTAGTIKSIVANSVKVDRFVVSVPRMVGGKVVDSGSGRVFGRRLRKGLGKWRREVEGLEGIGDGGVGEKGARDEPEVLKESDIKQDQHLTALHNKYPNLITFVWDDPYSPEELVALLNAAKVEKDPSTVIVTFEDGSIYDPRTIEALLRRLAALDNVIPVYNCERWWGEPPGYPEKVPIDYHNENPCWGWMAPSKSKLATAHDSALFFDEPASLSTNPADAAQVAKQLKKKKKLLSEQSSEHLTYPLIPTPIAAFRRGMLPNSMTTFLEAYHTHAPNSCKQQPWVWLSGYLWTRWRWHPEFLSYRPQRTRPYLVVPNFYPIMKRPEETRTWSTEVAKKWWSQTVLKYLGEQKNSRKSVVSAKALTHEDEVKILNEWEGKWVEKSRGGVKLGVGGVLPFWTAEGGVGGEYGGSSGEDGNERWEEGSEDGVKGRNAMVGEPKGKRDGGNVAGPLLGDRKSLTECNKFYVYFR